MYFFKWVDVSKLEVPTISWILQADSQNLSFSPLMKPIIIFFCWKKPLDAQAWHSLPAQQS